MKTVVVAHAFPPVGGSLVPRVVALTEQLSSAGSVLGVGARVGSRMPRREEDLRVSVPVIRTFPGPLHGLVHGWSHVEGGDLAPRAKAQSSEPRRSLFTRFISRGFRFVEHSYRRWEFIDSFNEWIPFLSLEVRKAVGDGVGVISMSMPNSCHVATMLALVGRKNFWWADFGDPWVLNVSQPRSGLRLWIESALESAIMARADLVTFTTEVTLVDYQRKYPSDASKMMLARMGHSTSGKPEGKQGDGWSIFYGGSLPPENRNASEFLGAAVKMQDVRFIFAGPCTAAVASHFPDGVPHNFELIEWLSDSDFKRALEDADAGVIFGNSNGQQIPGKVYQYLGQARRILYVIEGSDEDESSKVLGDEALSCPNEKAALEGAMRRLLKAPERIRTQDTGYEWDHVLSRAVRAFEQGLEGRSKNA